MTLNLDSETAQIDPSQWTILQATVCMTIANAKLDAFASEARRLADMVRFGLLPRNVAADYLSEAAAYNQLFYEYGMDHVQAIMSAAFNGEGA